MCPVASPPLPSKTSRTRRSCVPLGKIRGWGPTAIDRSICLCDHGEVGLRGIRVWKKSELRDKGWGSLTEPLQTTLRTTRIAGRAERRSEIHHGLIDHPGLIALR